MVKTDLKSKLFLIFFGFCLTFLLLELLLRLGGGVFQMLQERRNSTGIGQDVQEYRILCIGESTTAIGGEDSYPFQLQEILNAQGGPLRFKVINKGLVSRTTRHILDELDASLLKYKPQLVVAMMGINDNDSLIGIKEENSALRDLASRVRVVKFFKLLQKHLIATLQKKSTHQEEIAIPAENTSEFWIPNVANGEFDNVAVMENMFQRELNQMQTLPPQSAELMRSSIRASSFAFYLGNYYRLKKNPQKSKEYLDLSLRFNPRYVPAYIEMGIYYREQKDYKSAIEELKKAIELSNSSIPAHLELGRCLSEMGLHQEAYKFYNLIASSKPKDYWIYHEVGRWFNEHGYLADAQAVYLKALRENAQDLTVLTELVKVSDVLGGTKNAALYRAAQQKLQGEIGRYKPMTVGNYRQIIDAVLFHQAEFIAMQYPLRSIAPLKKILRGYETITFVENLTNFQEGLKNEKYSDYFIDRFAGDFGHCTGKGNRLIAQNLADIIQENILKTSGRPVDSLKNVTQREF